MKLLTNAWIMWRSLLSTFLSSVGVLAITSLAKQPRHRVGLIMQRWAKHMLQIVDLRYSISDPYHLSLEEGKPYILMSNHASHYDIPLILVALPGHIRMIAKKELTQVPVWGHAIKAAECIAIDRKNRQQAILDLQKAADLMQSGIIPWLAPEGTRTRSGKLLPFKKGGFMLALQTQATIIPIGIRHSAKALPPKTWRFSKHQHAEVHIGKPIDTHDYSEEQRDALIQRVRNDIAQLAQVEMESIDE